MKDLDEWRFRGGRVYDEETLKRPFVIPLIESLDYPSVNPVIVDVGSGSYSVSQRAQLPWPRQFSVANIDIALSEGSSGRRNRDIKVDIDELVSGEAPDANDILLGFIADRAEIPRAAAADLIVYSEILNYVDFKETISWFDRVTKPGGYILAANMPTRGYRSLFSERGVQHNEELLEFLQGGMGYELTDVQYPWGREHEYDEYLLVAAQKPDAKWAERTLGGVRETV